MISAWPFDSRRFRARAARGLLLIGGGLVLGAAGALALRKSVGRRATRIDPVAALTE